MFVRARSESFEHTQQMGEWEGEGRCVQQDGCDDGTCRMRSCCSNENQTKGEEVTYATQDLTLSCVAVCLRERVFCFIVAC